MLRKIFLVCLFVGTLLLTGFNVSSPRTSPAAQVPARPVLPLLRPASPSNFQSSLIGATISISTDVPIILKTGSSVPVSFCNEATAALTGDNIIKPNTAIQSLAVLESFETPQPWQVSIDTSGAGSSVAQNNAQAAAGSYSARAATQSSGGRAQVRMNFSDPAGNHSWQERPGTWHWQWANVYLPSSTVANLGPTEYLTLAGLFPSAGSSAGWWLRVRQGGELYVYGYDSDGAAREFQVYGRFPQDQWVALELGLHSQNGPGVKRAFAFLINGDFYGWYHQGKLVDETYDRAAMGILSTNSSDSLEVFIDQWAEATPANLPGGVDNRPTTNLQMQDYRTQSGVQWQIDWSTWSKDLRLDSQYGLYSNSERLQSGRNLDRMPDLSSGWAEIEIDWPKGTPPTNPNGYFGPMVGFRKEINREENLEIIPIGDGTGGVKLTLEAWAGGGPQIKTQWPMPLASIGGGSHIPEPGDVIRARWEQVSASTLNVKASYCDASTKTWYTDIINTTLSVTNIAGVDFTDGYHTASSITIDSPYYSIRRYQVGTLVTYP